MENKLQSNRFWKESKVTGFRDLSAANKLGYSIVRAYFHQHLHDESRIHISESVRNQLNLSGTFYDLLSESFWDTIGTRKGYCNCSTWCCKEDFYYDIYLFDTNVICIEAILSFYKIVNTLESVGTDFYVLSVEKVHPNGNPYHRIALIQGKPVQVDNKIFLKSASMCKCTLDSDDVFNSQGLFSVTTLGSASYQIVIGPDEQHPLIQISCKKYDSSSKKHLDTLDLFSVKLVPIYPTIHRIPDDDCNKIMVATINNLHGLEDDNRLSQCGGKLSVKDDDNNIIGSKLIYWNEIHSSLDNMKTNELKLALNIAMKEYELYAYSQFMKIQLHNCYNVSATDMNNVSDVGSSNSVQDEDKKENHNDKERNVEAGCEGRSANALHNMPEFLPKISINLENIKAHCNPSFSSFQNSNGISNSNSSSSSSSSENDNLCLTHPIVYLNVSGEKMSVLRASILRCEPLQDSQLAVRVSGRWQEQEQDVDEEGYIRYDLPKRPFKSLISYIRAYALKPSLAKLFIRREDREDLEATLNYLAISKESIPIQMT